MGDYKKMYDDMKSEYETYQKFCENRIQMLNKRAIELEKKADSLYNIVEINRYINSYISKDNIISLINDMLIGVFGVTYSTIFLVEEQELKIKSTNIKNLNINLTSYEISKINEFEEFIKNDKSPIKVLESDNVKIHSVIGVPIKLRNENIGYIYIEHMIYGFMTEELKMFLKSIANQIAIAIDNSNLYKKLDKMSKLDSLLFIYNRKYFFDFLDKKINQNDEEKFAIVMIDIDNFKKVNDTYGHQFGDKALSETVNIVRKWLDKDCVIARYGGEEIILYMPYNNLEDEVETRVDIIRKSIEQNKIVLNGISSSITASFGIAFYPADGYDANKLVKSADDLLYKSKRNGKNVVLSTYSNNEERNYKKAYV